MQAAYINYQSKYYGLELLAKLILWPMFLTGYVNGDVTIYCDKPLFSQQPGTDLGKFFKISSGLDCLPIGREEPTMLFKFGEEMPQRMSDFLQKDTWLGHHYMIELLEEPDEKYDEITFTLSFPITIERTGEYLSNIKKGNEAEIKTSDISHVKQLVVKFDWN